MPPVRARGSWHQGDHGPAGCGSRCGLEQKLGQKLGCVWRVDPDGCTRWREVGPVFKGKCIPACRVRVGWADPVLLHQCGSFAGSRIQRQVVLAVDAFGDPRRGPPVCAGGSQWLGGAPPVRSLAACGGAVEARSPRVCGRWQGGPASGTRTGSSHAAKVPIGRGQKRVQNTASPGTDCCPVT